MANGEWNRHSLPHSSPHRQLIPTNHNFRHVTFTMSRVTLSTPQTPAESVERTSPTSPVEELSLGATAVPEVPSGGEPVVKVESEDTPPPTEEGDDMEGCFALGDERLVRAARGILKGPSYEEYRVTSTALSNLQTLEQRLQTSHTIYAALRSQELCARWGLFSEDWVGRGYRTLRVPKRRLEDDEEYQAFEAALTTVDAGLDHVRESYEVLSPIIARHEQYKGTHNATTASLFPSTLAGCLDGELFVRPRKKVVTFPPPALRPPSQDKGNDETSEEKHQ